MPQTKKTILVVEDELYVQGMLEDFLHRQEYGVVVVPTAEEAFAAMEREQVDLVLLDKNLPDMSGVEVLSEIRFKNPDLPVIFMTGYPSERSRLLVEHLGICAYFEKPVNLKELGSAISEALDSGLSKQAAPKQAPGLSITMFSDVEAEHLPENVDVLLATNNETILSLLAEATPQIDGVVLCASEDEVFDYLQSRQANVLALDLGLLGSAALSIARWATSRDPALSILAIDREGTKSDVDQFLAGLNVRYVLGPDDMTPESCCPKLEILVRRAKMLRAMQRGDS